MTNATRLVVARNQTPACSIGLVFLAGVFVMAFGCWTPWLAYAGGVAGDYRWFFGVSLQITGMSFAGDAGRRLAVNRVIDEMVAALDRLD